jgi:DNA-directed RNA polymerase subunit RPC12/RpoP
MSTTTRTDGKVYVFACGKCGLEFYSLRPAKPVAACTQCGRVTLVRRVIAKPAAKTYYQAEREDAARG